VIYNISPLIVVPGCCGGTVNYGSRGILISFARCRRRPELFARHAVLLQQLLAGQNRRLPGRWCKSTRSTNALW